MGLEVLGPDINESFSNFSVNKKGQIRFGLSALKGVGEGPVAAILEERGKSGHYENLFDLVVSAVKSSALSLSIATRRRSVMKSSTISLSITTE